MKKIINIFLTVAVLSVDLAFSLPAMGYTVPDTVRVGLEYRYKNVSSAPVSNKNIIIGSEQNGRFEEETQLSGVSFTFNVPQSTIIDANEFYPSYNKALSACDDLEDMWGYLSAPALVDEGLWGVYIYDTGNDSSSYAADTVSGKIAGGTDIIVLKDSSEPVMFFDGINPQIKSGDSDVVTLSDRSYRGRIEFGRYTGGNITAVNVVGLEEYLYGVVPSEMPSSWESEAIKAQAVAARSYALTRRDMKVHEADGYELCDGTNCQVYIGYTNESESARNAVDSTEGVLAYYNGQSINAVFFSSSGGSTDNSENVWANEVAYLRAVPEINESAPSWTRTFTQEELGSLLSAKGKNVGTVESITISTGQYGRVQELKVNGSLGSAVLEKEETRTFCSASSQGSLVSRMYAINSEGFYIPSEDYAVQQEQTSNNDSNDTGSIFVTSANGTSQTDVDNLYAVNYSGEGEAVSGTMYAVTANGKETISAQNSAKTNTTVSTSSNKIYEGGTVYPVDGKFVFYGKGNGHGVGMSQYGAKGMAEAGYNYIDILKHYYTGITVE